ncbi:hypothetical protein SDC9_182683 [bioreactor metagenome]|uniref:Uncharacterized protein n=1 Tax=bioreactor metagenome TaxID=1076179 RepID=A0A645H9J6_9ZZZZ
MATDDFFRARLDQMIDLSHPLAVLAQRTPWAQIEATLAPHFARSPRPGKAVGGLDLFAPALQLAGAGVSARASTFAHPADGGAAVSQTRFRAER